MPSGASSAAVAVLPGRIFPLRMLAFGQCFVPLRPYGTEQSDERTCGAQTLRRDRRGGRSRGHDGCGNGGAQRTARAAARKNGEVGPQGPHHGQGPVQRDQRAAPEEFASQVRTNAARFSLRHSPNSITALRSASSSGWA